MRRDEMLAHPPTQRNERLIDWFIITESESRPPPAVQKRKKRNLRRWGLVFVIPHVVRCSYNYYTHRVPVQQQHNRLQLYQLISNGMRKGNEFIAAIMKRKWNFVLGGCTVIASFVSWHRHAVKNYLQLESFSPLLLLLHFGLRGWRRSHSHNLGET